MGKSKKKKLNAQPQNWIIWPMSAVLFVVPLVMCFYPIKADVDTLRLIGQAWNVDFFSQGKAVALYAISLFGAVFAAMEWRRFPKPLGDGRLRKYAIAGGVFLLFTLISSIFSRHAGVAFFGYYDHAEGFFTLLCYLYIMLFSAASWLSDCDKRWVTVPLMALLVIELIFCITQYVGNDLVLSGFFQALMGVPDGGAQSAFGAGIVYGTMYHYNHLGSFVGMILPLFAMLAINGSERPKWRVVYAVCAALSVVLLILCGARGAYVGIVCALLLGLILCAKHIGGWIAGHRALSMAALGVVVLAIVAVYLLSPARNNARIGAMLGDIKTLFTQTEDPKAAWPVRDLWNQADGTVKIDFPEGSLIVSLPDDDTILLTDERGETIPCLEEATQVGRNWIVQDERFSACTFTGHDDQPGIYAISAGKWREFAFLRRDETNGTYIGEYYLKEKMEIDRPEVAGFFVGKEKIGSMRGYIWGRTLPMLKNHILLGAGPDTFAYEFPNRDLLAKQYAYATPNIIVDKAHNQYLQTFVQNGGVALLAYLAILLLYIVDCVKLYGFKRQYAAREWFGLALCLAVFGYMGDTLFIDSCISVAPIFWVLLGVGIAVNRANRKEAKEGH